MTEPCKHCGHCPACGQPVHAPNFYYGQPYYVPPFPYFGVPTWGAGNDIPLGTTICGSAAGAAGALGPLAN